MYQLSTDSEFAFVLETFLSLANGGGAATGEVLRSAARIAPGNFESWYKEWKFMADAIASQGDAVNATKFPISAQQAYFRAASYYRAADFFLHGNASDPRILTLWASMLKRYDAAAKLLPNPPEKVELQGTGFKIPVYFYQAPQSSGVNQSQKIPTLIIGNGYDGAQQDLYHQFGQQVLSRGWNFVTYEGPGQATVRREQNIGFIPQWWESVTPVIDWLRERDDVDIDRIALQGVSFGGQLAPLAATQEHRIAALIALDGLLSLKNATLKKFPEPLVKLYESGNKSKFDDAILSALNKKSTTTEFKWGVEQGTWAFNVASPFDWIYKMGEMDLSPEMLKNISCPVFVASGQDDSLAPGQPEKMARIFGNQAHYHSFKTNVGAGEHCSIGAEPQLAMTELDWLANVFENVTKSP